MKVDDLLVSLDEHIGSVLDIHGYLIVVLDGDHHTVYLSATKSLEDKLHIRIKHRVAQLRRIIEPMHSMIMIRGGYWEDAPYIYRFPIHIRGRVVAQLDSDVLLQEIASVQLEVPYPPTLRQYTSIDHYLYHADVQYGASSGLAEVHTKKTLTFSHAPVDQRILSPQENCYARRIMNEWVQVPGILRYIRGGDGQGHYILTTQALRPGITQIGPLRSSTSIWWKPNPHYMVLRSQLDLGRDAQKQSVRVDLLGRVEYIGTDPVPFDYKPEPSIAIVEIAQITVYDTFSWLSA